MAERLWLGNNGTYQVLASYVCLFQDKKVKLRKPNGSVIAVPLHLLCEDDIAFIATQSGRLKTESTFKDPSKDQQQQQKQPIGILSSSPGYSSSSEKTMSTDAVKKNSETNELSTGPTEVLRHALTSAVNQHVRQITADESRKMLPNRSLSSITEKFKRHTFVDTPIVDHPTSHLAFLPTKIIGRLFAVLDTKSRFQLSLVNRRFHPFIYKPDTWKSIWFAQEDIDDIFLFRLAVFLQRQDLRKAVERVVLDGTKVTCSSVLLVIKHLENVETLSIQSCWNIHSYQLAVDLTHLAKSSSIKNRLAQVIVGKVLHRGPVENWSPMEPPLDSKSFGQDIWLAHSALNRLTNRNVAFDVALCNTCHLGAAAHDFQCISCGILPLLKCVGCAPRCDR
ncbi:hypothetical protein G6F57_009118 [Rhizopus arrhizus]|uniref:F-box domain-containing protein n=1 Tax=Rhizopus oryzae TaxID=64495 RepID=A0A9P7BQ82_RHIOR|nr:hypothetical protein G6F23_008609 [Rhizopus arrhizus]KAG1414360.1 hypothetical protein G6F58_006997 [Rhizopus delemar]KAG0759375.1 hypothetical protein G6F24_009109 [Rhizopus arrhizus]KAG0785608.1 hypothetical protein G6F21_009144 [Rhizopus arrhizus]KAG0787895.1 hypothetical protein G6F22_007170 [Rhizopus arrhizus]